MPDNRLQYLFDRYMSNACSEAEEEELASLSLVSENEEKIKNLLAGYWETEGNDQDMAVEKSALILQSILHPQMEKMIPEPAKIRKLNWRRWAAAASVLFVLGAGSYFLFYNKANKPTIATAITHPIINDVQAPKETKATITLADGSTVAVDSLTSLTQSNVKLIKTADGKIVYSGQSTKISYNTLTNPRGSKVIDMVLADGSKVWLNAGSSVTYPVTFIGNERKVSITGEAYFEVAHNAAMPFKVTKGEMEVTVLGTHFNVNAYDDESDIKVTLLEGSVMVRNEAGSVTIKPGQQAKLISNHQPEISNPNLDEVMAWKNGRFAFYDADITTVMNQLARWYDLDVLIKGEIKEKFHVEITRNTNISNVFKILEATGGVHLKIEGNKVIVMP